MSAGWNPIQFVDSQQFSLKSQIERRAPQRIAPGEHVSPIDGQTTPRFIRERSYYYEIMGLLISRNGISLIVERVLLRVGGHP
ncbi:MAG: hypothetical protein ACLQBK_24545 [Candidatus Sulfotelmatobacter sp.]